MKEIQNMNTEMGRQNNHYLQMMCIWDIQKKQLKNFIFQEKANPLRCLCRNINI